MEELLQEMFDSAMDQLILFDLSNIVNDVCERNLCSRLAVYLEHLIAADHLDGYYADVEYNRMRDGQIKTIIDGQTRQVKVCCDLIVHSRAELEEDNLMAIELKKSYRDEAEKESDRLRLRALTRTDFKDIWPLDAGTEPQYVCGYRLGYYIELNIDEHNFKVEKYRRGDIVDSWQVQF
jgi:hypothetical protein